MKILIWSSHCNKIAYKTSRTLGIMNRLKHELPSAILKLLYDALIMSHFQYCITSWGYSCYRLFKLQKRAIRIVTLSKYNAHTDPLFKSNKLLKIEDIFEIQCFKLYYRYRKVILPKYLLDMFIENRDVHSHYTRQTSYLHHGVTRTVSARNCIRYSLPVLIDRTSNNVLQRVTNHSTDAFEFLAKSYALERYENDCHIRNCYICRRRWMWHLCAFVNQYVVLCIILLLPIITYVTMKWFVFFIFIIPPMSQGFFLHVCPLKYPFVM